MTEAKFKWVWAATEFQYLSDTNARVILSAFQMSPEELPGYLNW